MDQSRAPIVEKTFELASRLRQRRIFHPDGLVMHGNLRAAAEFEQYFGKGNRPVVVRLSKALGTPGRMPDILGLAIRVRDARDNSWDFALATTLTGSITRFILSPSYAWRHARYGSLMPYRFDGDQVRWLFALPDQDQPASASLDELREHARSHDLRFSLTAQSFGADSRPFAELVLTDMVSASRSPSFDPTMAHPAEVTLAPAFITKIRKFAYRGSRQGRHAANAPSG